MPSYDASKHPDRMQDPLLGKIWRTKSARFNAYWRLRTRQGLSLAATTLVSVYIITASLILLVFGETLTKDALKLSSSAILALSIAALCVNLLESNGRYQSEADKMHQCALELSELYNEFQALSLEKADQLREEMNTRYSSILRRFEVNHQDCDFAKFQLANSAALNLGARSKFALRVQLCMAWMTDHFLYIILILSPVFLVAVIPFCGFK